MSEEWQGKHVLIVALLCLAIGFLVALNIWGPR